MHPLNHDPVSLGAGDVREHSDVMQTVDARRHSDWDNPLYGDTVMEIPKVRGHSDGDS